jgi:hypothetical protein
MEINNQTKAAAQALQFELVAVFGAGEFSSVGIGEDGFVVGVVRKKTLASKKLLPVWSGRPVAYTHVGKVRPA